MKHYFYDKIINEWNGLSAHAIPKGNEEFKNSLDSFGELVTNKWVLDQP